MKAILEKIILVSGIFISLSAALYADDGWVEVQGSSARLLEEHPTISMADEYVLIELMPEKYKVTASFNFYNSGESTTVAVGFPVSGSSESKLRDFLSFKTWVNGAPASVKKFREFPEEAEYAYFKVKTVDFLGLSTTTSIVEYEAPYGKMVGPLKWVTYDYSTGRSWKGPIGKVLIDLRFPEDLLGMDVTCLGGTYSLQHRAPGQMVFQMNDLKPKPAQFFMAVFNPWGFCLSDAVRKHEYVQGFCSLIAGGEDALTPKRKIVMEKANYPTLAVLRLRRNAIYARHGFIFKDKDLKKYFSNLEWYKPRADFKDSDLSEAEKQKITELKALEAAINSTALSPLPFSIPGK